jgi:hypothetical protein
MIAVHFIIFEATSEERTRPGSGLDLCGGLDLERISTGDIVWIITRMGGDRPVPGVCGRIHAAGVAPHLRGDADFDPLHADCRCRLLVDEDQSERSAPFCCDMIASWDIWRQPFRGVRMLTDEQGQTLEAEWKQSARRTR